MKKIPLTQGYFAIVDNKDYPTLTRNKWLAYTSPTAKTFYAGRCKIVKGKREFIPMHREILGLVYKDGVIVDHKDGDGLNNQRYNLRKVTKGLNGHNCKLYSSNSTGYKGVQQISAKKWKTVMRVKKKITWVGAFSNIIDAAKAYDKMAILIYGKSAKLNFPLKRRNSVCQ